jgi:hypothetical protein
MSWWKFPNLYELPLFFPTEPVPVQWVGKNKNQIAAEIEIYTYNRK